MADRPNIGAVLLAAGASCRFGKADKLAAEYRGFLLGHHAALVFPLELVRFAWVIVAERGHPCEPGWFTMGFDPIVNPDAEQGMGTSIALAARMAQRKRLDALVITLADMPLVPGEHLAALIEAVGSPEDIAVSAVGDTRMPPAVFGSAHFAALAALQWDRGARDLIAQGRIVDCPPEWLADVDTPGELKRIE